MTLKFRLFRYRYRINVSKRYCGAVATCLVPRKGEDWLRGNDLRDGSLCRFSRVLWDVLAYEFSFGRWRHRVSAA